MCGPFTLTRAVAAAVLALAVLGAAAGPARSEEPAIAAPATDASYCKDGAVRELELTGIGLLTYCVPTGWLDYELEPEEIGESVLLGFDRDESPDRFYAEIEVKLSSLYPKPDEASIKVSLKEIAPNVWRRRRALRPRIESFDRGPLYGYYYRVQSAAETDTPYLQHGTAAIRDLELRFGCQSEVLASEAHAVLREIVKSIRYEGTRPIDPACVDFRMSPGKARGVSERAIRDSLVAEWSFDEQLGRTAFDGSGNGHDGLIEGAEWGIGARGGGLLFDGDSYVEVPDHPDFDLAEQGTLQAWARYADEGIGGQVIGKCLDAESFGDCNFSLGLEDPAFVSAAFCVGEGGTGSAACTDISSHGFDRMIWHQVVVTWDGTLLRIYLDGRLKRLSWQTVVPGLNEYPVMIGNGFTGRLDEVKIFDRALTAEEVAALYSRPRKN
jgi:hypothetical protein